MAIVTFKSPKTQLIETLENESTELYNLMDDFRKINPKPRLRTFHESKETRGLENSKIIPKVMVVDKTSATMGFEEKVLDMGCDHHQLVKFDSIDSAAFEILASTIEDFVEGAEEQTTARLTTCVIFGIT
ncbi:hypothetical protein H072_3677 [Dactylellina haptotyla CBS 200.50]|uniref:Uncharacterized protein n=1 Tax=Dactylellina haptotyla (strain CBS 200.50) TaxID=1284197 RepID=S8AHP5_DACHA|nr:hypothetical protein H072_3677 [Dactylellina haptotyla CBS 200.50]